uniref:Serine-rich protein-like protein n=1 Tax=Medicago truncatula TaxID=3880 RepID=B7FN20_MEDTR|nr:unknown [Medicago truncatula]
MAAASRKSRTNTVLRSLSPSPRFCNSQDSPPHYYSSSSTAFASSTSSFTSRSTSFFRASTSPTRVSLYGSSPSASSVRFSLDRSISPNRSISAVPRTGVKKQSSSQPKRTCMCSPTTHPGSFRCSLHKGFGSRAAVTPYSQNRLNARRSAMTNSLVGIRGVEGDLVKRALAALIRPSSHQQKRRGDFHPRPSRLSVMTKAQDS